MTCESNKKLPDLIEHEFDYENAKIAFNQQVGYLIREKGLVNKVVQQKTDIDKIIHDIKLNKLHYKSYFSTKCQLINENGKYILGQVYRIERNVEHTKIWKVEKIKQLISLDELFDVMSELHMQEPSLHEEEVLNHLSNCVVSMPFISLFRKSCKTCNTTTESLDKHYRVVAEMTIFKLDSPDGLFTDILLYIDRNTNFVLLRPLQSVTDHEIACELATIFADFTTPAYIYSEGIRSTFSEYNSILNILKSAQPPFSIPPMFPSKTNQKSSLTTSLARKKLIDWMKETGSTNWAIGAHLVQWQMNTNKVIDTYIRSRVVCGPICSPYHAMFGLLPRTHLAKIKKKHQPVSTLRSDKVLVDCSQCHQPIYKVYKCCFCKRLCHFSCCIRFVEQAAEVPIINNKCISCVNSNLSVEETMYLNTTHIAQSRVMI